MSDEDAVSGVEALKAASHFLRYPLVEELAAPGNQVDDDAYQILKFHGSYQQDDRDQRNVRRKAGEEYAFGFMIRLRLPGGDVHPGLWNALDDLAGQFGRSTLRLTTRQSIQLHFVPKAELRTVIRTVHDHLASTLGACGDVNRNVMAAPLPLADARYAAVRDTARAISEHLLPRTRAYAELWLDGEEVARIGPDGDPPLDEEPLYGRTYLPRKFKTCVTVAGDNSVDLFTHDLGVAGIFEGDALVGWNVFVGGGLGRTHRKPETFPRLADPLGFVAPQDLLRVAESVVIVQRDHGDRSDRRHARLKYLIHDRGIEWFRARVEEVAGLALAPIEPVPWDRADDRLGWHPQGDGGWFHGLRIENGRVRDDDGGTLLRAALRSLTEDEGLALRITPNQNVYVLDVPADRRAAVEDILERHHIPPSDRALGLHAVSMACPALPTCGLAVTDAERALPGLLDELQVVFDELGLGGTAPTVRMTGCPNGCARPYVAEIGLVGDAVDRYQVWLGGDAAGTRLARPVADRVPRADLPTFLRPLLERYREERLDGESLGDYTHRAGVEVLTPSAPSPVAPSPGDTGAAPT
jgi:sulfite reductase (ferredoxin)